MQRGEERGTGVHTDSDDGIVGALELDLAGHGDGGGGGGELVWRWAAESGGMGRSAGAGGGQTAEMERWAAAGEVAGMKRGRRGWMDGG